MQQIETPIYRDDDALLDSAYSIFLELASDNLAAPQIKLFNEQFADKGALELHEPFSDWLDYLGDEIEALDYVEIIVGLHNSEQQLTHRFANLLIPKNSDDPLCHIIWAE